MDWNKGFISSGSGYPWQFLPFAGNFFFQFFENLNVNTFKHVSGMEMEFLCLKQEKSVL